ncbi:hypothetical protein QWY75_08040 [Pontixanthobacter aestiaquae]|uniref:Uncharacterized protein n=1 Tax=Pontixanthobacter aestiaquae TaxID=1509367 RepID=A0A844Z5T2_9SPHN|nr:hypothetical protein [Pontixanthobacter aestiaquae]MDN3646154.1 hypothetical protein [Pontixanthobacter aestiaquae]MXO82854.1 hypothetical protein [Pontixanthobacter aestiaquae]
MDDSNFASLSPTLLARKGGAKPAMRPQMAPLTAGSAAQSLEDLGWNDMGAEDDAPKHDAEVAHLTPAPANPEADAEAQELAEQAEAALTDLLAEKPVVRRQQEGLYATLSPAEAGSSEGQEFEEEDEPEQREEQPVQADALPVEEVPQEPAPVQLHAKPSRNRRSALDRGKRAAFTLRLDADRHLKLRLACTLRNRSAQQLVTEALDQLLGDMPDVDSLAAQVRT